MFKIEPIQFPIMGTAEYLELSVLQFSMDAVVATFYYQILDMDGKLLTQGNLTMSESEFAMWAEDNQYCVDWAVAELGLVLVPEVEAEPEV